MFEFLKSAELAYLSWENSVQKINQVYNKHLSDEIKFYLINISDDYSMMKTWLITNYGGLQELLGIFLAIYPRELNQCQTTERKSLVFMQ